MSETLRPTDTRCVFCGKRPEEPDEAKIMLLNEKLYRCYCVTLEEYRKEHTSEEQAYGNDCPSGNCEV